MPDMFGNTMPDDVAAQQAREAAAGRTRRAVGGQNYPQQQIPPEYQTWGNLAETTAQQYPNFQNWTPGQGPPPISEIEKVMGMAGVMGDPYDMTRYRQFLNNERLGFSPEANWRATRTQRSPLHGEPEQESGGPRGFTAPRSQLVPGRQGQLQDIFSFPEAYQNWPRLGQTPYHIGERTPQLIAGYHPTQDYFHLTPAVFSPWQRSIMDIGRPASSLMTHEIAHAAQAHAGRPALSVPPTQLRDYLTNYLDDPGFQQTPQYRKFIDTAMYLNQRYPNMPPERKAYEAFIQAYNAQAGESIPLTAEWRRNFSPQRLASETPAKSMEDMMARNQFISEKIRYPISNFYDSPFAQWWRRNIWP